ncbi:MAG TPA: CocE/NonD family hydrolase [Terriglobales bacterium]|nr:CocE/NonD family hydrolase [Terriglobales bacterium]
MLGYAVHMNGRWLLLIPVLLQAVVAAAGTNAEKQVVEKDVAIPMRDRVVLRADILRPSEDGRFPVLVYRTPYGKEFALREYTTFQKAVERGYAVVVQDVRGRYASEGDFRPYQNEGRDGYDTIEWAARQPWSSGDVGTFGLSYPGAVQWLAAVESPPHLKAMVPAMTFSTPQNFFYSHGLWDLSWIEWIWDNIAPDVRLKRNLPGPKSYEEALAEWKQVGPKMLGFVPLSKLEDLQTVAPYYYDWLSHPPEDPWWDWCDLRNKYARVRAAVLNLSGWYDDNYGPEGATTNFAGLRKSHAAQSDAGTHLLLGPWVHGVDSTASPHSGDRDFGSAAIIDYDEVVLRWMDHYVRGIDNGVEKEAAVRYFVMGANRWREAANWPPAAEARSFYLRSAKDSQAKNILSTAAPSARSQALSFVSDPAQPVTNIYSSSGAHDYRELSQRKDVLTFDSAPLEHDLEVTGPIQADIFVSCDCRDLDLWTRVLDVFPDGTSFNLMTPGLDVQRASYRELSRGRQLLQPGGIYELHLNDLLTSNVFLKGHRIRLQISASFSPNFSRNPQTGESEAVSARMQKATIYIYADRQHPSHLVLPIVTR